MTYTKSQVASMIDHTNLKPFATDADIRKLCREAAENHFASACVNPAQVKHAAELLAGTGVKTCSVIAFPLGQLTIAEKVAEAKLAMADGAEEIDYVLNIGQLKSGNRDYIREEMQAMTDAAHECGRKVKVIFDTCYLEKDEIRAAAAVARDVKPDFIKTSTGFGTGGALAEDVKLMKETAGPDVAVKASGGIRNWESAKAMLEAGASRIGTSNGIDIISGMPEE